MLMLGTRIHVGLPEPSSKTGMYWQIVVKFPSPDVLKIHSSFCVNMQTRCANIHKCISKKRFVWNAPEVYVKQQFFLFSILFYFINFSSSPPPGVLSITSC